MEDGMCQFKHGRENLKTLHHNQIPWPSPTLALPARTLPAAKDLEREHLFPADAQGLIKSQSDKSLS